MFRINVTQLVNWVKNIRRKKYPRSSEVDCVCSCGKHYPSLSALLEHANEAGGLLHGDYE